MNQGVIKSLKTCYRGLVTGLLCGALNKCHPYPKMSILQAMKILVASCKTVTQKNGYELFQEGRYYFLRLNMLSYPIKDLAD